MSASFDQSGGEPVEDGDWSEESYDRLVVEHRQRMETLARSIVAFADLMDARDKLAVLAGGHADRDALIRIQRSILVAAIDLSNAIADIEGRFLNEDLREPGDPDPRPYLGFLEARWIVWKILDRAGFVTRLTTAPDGYPMWRQVHPPMLGDPTAWTILGPDARIRELTPAEYLDTECEVEPTAAEVEALRSIVPLVRSGGPPLIDESADRGNRSDHLGKGFIACSKAELREAYDIGDDNREKVLRRATELGNIDEYKIINNCIFVRPSTEDARKKLQGAIDRKKTEGKRRRIR
jgi:hypothetical protein